MSRSDQARCLRHLLQRIDCEAGKITITFNAAGIKTLAEELASGDQLHDDIFAQAATFSFDLDQTRPKKRPGPQSPPRVPRLARLLALALKLEGLVRDGTIRDYATLARLGHVSRARMSQLMNLLLLAPDIQEEILFLPPSQTGRDPITLRHLQPIARVPSWTKQRRLWHQLKRKLLRNAPAQRQ